MLSGLHGIQAARAEVPIADGVALAESGFEMLDVGAVAARSGPPVPTREEAERLVPTIEGLVAGARVPISADTFSPAVAERALEAGAVAVNDIGGGGDPALLELVAASGCGFM